MTEKLVFHAQHKKPIGWVMQRSWVWSYKCDLVGGLEHVLFFHILGMSSSQLTNSYFSEGQAQPPTRHCFNQEMISPGMDVTRLQQTVA